jgi:4-amino-4-deoxy-L-arabinose transferase-like glycosyltransferase
LIRRLLKPPWLSVLVALLLRVALIAALGAYHKDPSEGQIHFGYETGRVARSIVLGQGISSPFHDPSGPTGILMPLFPYLLAGVFKLFGIYTNASGFVILTLCSLFSALTCAVVFSIGEVTFSRTVANISSWTWAFHPVAVFISVLRIWETTLATLLLSLVVLLTLRLERDTRLWVWFGYGVLWGLTALSNPTVVAVMPFWGAWLWYRLGRQGTRPERFVALAAFALVLSVSPWFIRNYRVFHQFIPFRTNFGLELQIGNNPVQAASRSTTCIPSTTRGNSNVTGGWERWRTWPQRSARPSSSSPATQILSSG